MANRIPLGVLPLWTNNHAVSHRPVATQPLLPHSIESGMGGINKIDDTHVILRTVLTMKAPSVLL
jgi:hypothetical protein